MDFFQSLQDFYHYDFLAQGLIATILLALITGLLSPFVVAKKYAFIGEGVGHSTLFGLSIAQALLGLTAPLPIFFTTLLITLIIGLILAFATFRQKLPTDSMIGIFLATSLAAGVLIYSLFGDNKNDLINFLFGNIILINQYDIYILLGLTVFVFIAMLLPFKSWIFYIYDEEGAQVKGIPTVFFHFFFFFILTVVIVSSIKMAGTILVNTLLLVPGSMAYKFSNSLKKVFLISLVFALTTSVLGLILANWWGLPPGATYTMTQVTLFAILVIGKRLLKEGL